MFGKSCCLKLIVKFKCSFLYSHVIQKLGHSFIHYKVHKPYKFDFEGFGQIVIPWLAG
jgi:hypothetical protein